MAGQPPRHFPFVQFEFGFLLGPEDGRYVTRDEPDGEPERIVVLRTVGAPRKRAVGGRRPRKAEGAGEPEPVPVARATVIRAEPFESKDDGREWLEGLRRDSDGLEAETADAARELNAVLRAHRAAAADPHVRDTAARGANAVRVGYGSGDQVADGHFTDAYTLPPAAPGSRIRRRAEALAPDERLAGILARREEVLACEELVLRARSDLDAGRPREAALQARVALEAALAELGEPGALAADREVVARAANEALAGEPSPELQEQVADAVGRMETALRRRRLKRV